MFDRITSVVIALSLAILVWLYARSRQLDSFDRGYRDQAVTRPEPQAEREVYDVECAVHFLCPEGFPMQPRIKPRDRAMVSLRIEGPIGAGAPKAAAYVDLTRKRYDKGQYAEPVHVDLPAGYQIQSDDLPAVAFDLVPIKPDDRSKPADAP